MRMILLAALAGVSAAAALAQPVQRNAYIRKDGTYVAPSYATRPNDTKLDNYSTQGNNNPYNGKFGTVDPYKPTYPNGSSYGGSNGRRKPGSPY